MFYFLINPLKNEDERGEKEIRDERKWEGYWETLYLKGGKEPVFFFSSRLNDRRQCPLVLPVKVRLREDKQNRRGFSPPAKYTDRATAACRRS
jgi:hypothetical protein